MGRQIEGEGGERERERERERREVTHSAAMQDQPVAAVSQFGLQAKGTLQVWNIISLLYYKY